MYTRIANSFKRNFGQNFRQNFRRNYGLLALPLALPIFGISIEELKERKDRELERFKHLTEKNLQVLEAEMSNQTEKLIEVEQKILEIQKQKVDALKKSVEMKFEDIKNLEIGLESNFLESKIELIIDWLFADYNEEISLLQNFKTSLHKFLPDSDDIEDFTESALNMLVLSLSEEVFRHQSDFLDDHEIEKISRDSDFIKTVGGYLKFAHAAYSDSVQEFVDKTEIEKNGDVLLFTSMDTESSYLKFDRGEEVTRPEFYIIYREKTHEIMISIRGTKTLMDAVTDLMVGTIDLHIPEMSTTMMFHEGMLKSSSYVLEQAIPVIDKFISENPKAVENVSFTGHSLGGGCAQICGLLFRQHVFDKDFRLDKIVDTVLKSTRLDTLKAIDFNLVSKAWVSLLEFAMVSKNSDLKIQVYTFAAPPIVNYSKKGEDGVVQILKNAKSQIVEFISSNVNDNKNIQNEHLREKAASVSEFLRKDYVDFSAIKNTKIINFQCERDIICYASVGNYTRLMLALRRINELNWDRLEKVRYILGQREKLSSEKSKTLEKACELLDGLIMKKTGKPPSGAVRGHLDVSQELIKLSVGQKGQLLQHICIPELVDGVGYPVFYRLKPVDDGRKEKFEVRPVMAGQYECVKMRGDIGVEVLPIGWKSAKSGHINTHGCGRYQDAFDKLK